MMNKDAEYGLEVLRNASIFIATYASWIRAIGRFVPYL